MMKRLFALVLFLLSTHQVMAGPCVLDQSACLDATPCKTIAGENICLVDMGETCWKYKDDYTCVKVGAEQQCEPLMQASTGCFQVNATCIATDPADGSCFTHEMTWQCPDWQMATPPDVTRLDDTINYVKNALNESSCGASNACTTTSETCIEGPETRTISGVDVFKNCWKWNREYTCSSANSADCIVNDSDPTCTLTNTVCATLNPDGSCALYSKTYTCSSNTIDTSAANAQCAGGGAPCTTQTVTLPPETRTEGCQETMEANPENCDRTRNVQVDKDYLYQCNSSTSKVANQSCQKTLDVQVQIQGCTPGALLYETSIPQTGSAINWIRIYCTAVPNELQVQANLGAWCNPGNSTSYIHNAQIGITDAGVPYIAQYGYKRAYEQAYCSDFGNCTNSRVCSGASCPPLQCHPANAYNASAITCSGTFKSGYNGWPVDRTDPISYLDQSKVMWMSYARRGCATSLTSGSCDPVTGMCNLNFNHTTEYNWDDSIFGDRSNDFTALNMQGMRFHTETDTWIDQCVVLDARTQ